MKTLFTSLFIAFAMTLSAQDCREGRCFGTGPHGGGSPDDGNNFLGQTYNQSMCGLNFVATSHMITQRYTGQPTGVGLPAQYNMQMPACVGINGAYVDKAYVWWGVSYFSGSSTTPTLTITNPMGQVSNIVASLVGTSGPKCWGELGTRTFRADVTSTINGNGNYTLNITGNPVMEIDGATFVIIYRDPAGSYTGTMVIHDGCETYMGAPPNTANTTLANFSACANSVNGRGFSVTGDQQNNISPPSHQTIVNGVTQTFPNTFWNYDEINANVTSGQTSVVISNTPNPSDCWSWNVVGYYFQTNCTTCTATSALTVSDTSANAVCGLNNGWAAVTVTGGTAPYTYAWSTVPSQTTATATGLGAGSYTVNISDASGCNFATEVFTISATPAVVATVTPGGPIQACSGNPSVLHANTGTGYTYQWYDNGNPISGATLDSLVVGSSGNYSVEITDGNGCSDTSAPVSVTQGQGPVVTVAASGGTCGAGVILLGYSGSPIVLTATAPGAVTYLWNTGNPGDTLADLTITQPGTYTVTAWDANGCPSTGPGGTFTVTAINVACGHNMDKIILCHVPPGNPNNPQTICVSASAIPSHLANHPGDCIGPCSLYYPRTVNELMTIVNEVGFFAEAYPNPSSNSFALHLIADPTMSIRVNIYDVTGRIVETHYNVTEQTQIGTNLSVGVYTADVIQGEDHQKLHLVKVN
jgi:hypothetical protein